MKKIVEKLMGGLVISCQAYEDTPLYGPDYMVAFAKCAEMGGATGLRACWPQDISAIKKAVPNLPIIGINKRFGTGDPLDEIFITPDFKSAKEVIDAGADILALDCTIRPIRPFDELVALLKEIRNAYPDIPIMADLSTLDEGIQVANTGLVDIISATLAGYTRQSLEWKSDGPAVELVREMKKNISLPINAEGRIWERGQLKEVIDAGADMVCIGSAVTRPHLITERFVKANTQYRK